MVITIFLVRGLYPLNHDPKLKSWITLQHFYSSLYFEDMHLFLQWQILSLLKKINLGKNPRCIFW